MFEYFKILILQGGSQDNGLEVTEKKVTSPLY